MMPGGAQHTYAAGLIRVWYRMFMPLEYQI